MLCLTYIYIYIEIHIALAVLKIWDPFYKRVYELRVLTLKNSCCFYLKNDNHISYTLVVVIVVVVAVVVIVLFPTEYKQWGQNTWVTLQQLRNHKHWWSCWWSPEKPEAHRAGNPKKILFLSEWWGAGPHRVNMKFDNTVLNDASYITWYILGVIMIIIGPNFLLITG